VNNTTIVNRVSYNGGQGGTAAKPTERERGVEREQIRQATADQIRHEHAARGNRALRASENKGIPPIAATPRSGAFTDRNVQPAKADAAQRNDRREGDRAPPETAPAERRQRE